MEHLITYPYIKEKVENGTLKIYGWYYDLGKGNVYNYNIEKEVFELIG